MQSSKQSHPESRGKKISPVVRRVHLKDANDDEYDLLYWLGKPVQERAAAVTTIIMQSVNDSCRMDKSQVAKHFLNDAGGRL